LLLLTGVAFTQGMLDATTHTLMWSVSFFFASAAASSAYLTVSEIFPLELRALAIALFYAVGTGTGGLIAPALFGALIERGSRVELFGGYAIAAALMVSAALVALRIGVSAERKALEDIAPPLSKAD
jgi:MFS family permease